MVLQFTEHLLGFVFDEIFRGLFELGFFRESFKKFALKPDFLFPFLLRFDVFVEFAAQSVKRVKSQAFCKLLIYGGAFKMENLLDVGGNLNFLSGKMFLEVLGGEQNRKRFFLAFLHAKERFLKSLKIRLMVHENERAFRLASLDRNTFTI